MTFIKISILSSDIINPICNWPKEKKRFRLGFISSLLDRVLRRALRKKTKEGIEASPNCLRHMNGQRRRGVVE